MKMRVSVLGSGNGGCALAAEWALAGHEVSMFDFKEFPINIEAINKNGGIYSEGYVDGFAKLKYAGHNIEEAISSAEVIFIVGPAFSTEPFARACKPYLKDGQIVIICPSSCGGSVIFKNELNLDISDDSIIVADTSTLPYACRIIEPGKVKVFWRLTGGFFVAALPSKHNEKVYQIVKSVYEFALPAKNALQTTLQNANPVIHPAVSLLNAGLIERTNGDFYFYEEGVTPAVGRLMRAIDNERVAVGEKLGITVIPDNKLGVMQGYMEDDTYETGYSTANGFKGIKAQSQLDHRYINEDVGYGLVFISELGKQINVPTPVIDSMINVVSAVMNRDYKKERARTMKSMGLGHYSAEELNEIL